MHQYPIISSVGGILINVAVLTVILLLSWTKFFLFTDEVDIDNNIQRSVHESNIKVVEVEEKVSGVETLSADHHSMSL